MLFSTFKLQRCHSITTKYNHNKNMIYLGRFERRRTTVSPLETLIFLGSIPRQYFTSLKSFRDYFLTKISA